MSEQDQSWRTAPEPPTRRERIAALPEHYRQQFEDGLITLAEAESLAAGLRPNRERK
jgi:hypothetical protein